MTPRAMMATVCRGVVHGDLEEESVGGWSGG